MKASFSTALSSFFFCSTAALSFSFSSPASRMLFSSRATVLSLELIWTRHRLMLALVSLMACSTEAQQQNRKEQQNSKRKQSGKR